MVFQNISNTTLYVHAGSLEAYKAAYTWKDFGSIFPISAKETETTGIQAIPASNAVDIAWPAIFSAASYELIIKDAGGNIICTLDFDLNGQLVSFIFNAPSRDDAPQRTYSSGFSYLVTGLNPQTSYDAIIIAKDEDGHTVDIKSASFTTTSGAQGIEDVRRNDVRSTKVIKDGQILILRGEKAYTLQGQEVR